VKKKAAILRIFTALFGVWLVFLPITALHAESATFGGAPLSHSYITRDGSIFVALSDINDRLGVSVVYDGTRLMLGGTIHGTLVVDPSTHILNIRNRSIDYKHNLVLENEEWYVPEEFLERALGVTTWMDTESGNLSLYPLVVSIYPCETLVQINSSLVPNFQTFELSDPPRRVIDITNACLNVTNLSVGSNDLGVGGVAEIRASQWQVDPPTVRVVIEWDSDPAPGHTLFPDNKSLSIMIGSNVSETTPSFGPNLLETSPEIPQIAVEPAGNTTIDNPLIDPPVRLPDPGGIPPGETSLEPVYPIEDPIPQGTDGEENIPLAELGWDVAFEMSPEGEITTTITAPAFDEINDFTLAGDGMRIVLDLKGSVLQGHGERYVGGLGEINGIRLGQFEENTTRIVFDMRRVVAYKLESDPAEGNIVIRILKGDLVGKTICIDPGHGGRDSGAPGPIVDEKDLNLEMAYFLKEYLKEQGANIVMTRETDIFIPLASRINIARQAQADLFVCIHNNATEEPTALQGSLFLYSDQDFMPLYRLVHRGVAARTGVPGLGLVEDERGLYILRHADGMPVVFVEGAFMTNAVDYARLTDQSRVYSKNIMLGVMDGILAYYSGRDLPPVEYPDIGSRIDVGIFDLVGSPVVIDHEADTGSAWGDTPPETVSDTGESTDGIGDGESDEEDNSYHRRRGRGGYRFD
jgi:N-acetylmuramoyl-L-alanine amidase